MRTVSARSTFFQSHSFLLFVLTGACVLLLRLQTAVAQNTLLIGDADTLISSPLPVTNFTQIPQNLSGQIRGITGSRNRNSLFFTDSGGDIYSGPASGQDASPLVSAQFPNDIVFDNGSSVIDDNDDRLFVIEGSLPNIISRNPDDGAVIFTIFTPGDPNEVEIDAATGTLYYSVNNNPTPEIRAVNRDGSNDRPVISRPSASAIRGMVFVPGRGLFWSEQSNGGIYFLALNSSTPITVLLNNAQLPNPGDLSADTSSSGFQGLYVLRASGSELFRLAFDGVGGPTLVNQNTLSSPTAIFVFPGDSILNPNTRLNFPPDVVVDNGTRSVTLFFQDFSDVTDIALSAVGLSGLSAAGRNRLTFRYDASVNDQNSPSVTRRITKNNQVTISNLPPSQYTTNYQVILFRKKTKAQQARARARGITGMRVKLRRIATTNVSPTTGFSISE
jgi:hypothetical protein